MSARIPFSKWLIWTLTGAAILTFGCDDPLKNASLIGETRVLGARVEVSGDATRGSPAPGESARFRLFLAAPNGVANAAYAFSLCGVAPTSSGFPPCSTAPFGAQFQATPVTAEPELDFDVPTDVHVSATPHGLARGIVCPDDQAELTAEGEARCERGAGDSFAFEFDLAGPGEDNGNPMLTAGSLTLDGAPWSASDVLAACDSLTTIGARTKHSVGVQLQETDFDSLLQRNAEDPARETLLVSQFSSAGKLEHTFGSLTLDTPALTSTVGWDAPEQADASGTVVHFYFVVRDSRGGEDFASRALCVVQ